jgi:hypothetical protein
MVTFINVGCHLKLIVFRIKPNNTNSQTSNNQASKATAKRQK